MTCYASVNFPSKKALKEAVARGDRVGVNRMTPFHGYGGEYVENGVAAIDGPWSPQPHKWGAVVNIANGVIVKVK